MGEARAALATVSGTLASAGNFCLCHGIAGNADLLLYASQALGEDRWLAGAQDAGQQGAARYERRFIPWPCGTKTGNEVPGLMLGLAGIGYFYLRLADPASIPVSCLPALKPGDGTAVALMVPAATTAPGRCMDRNPDTGLLAKRSRHNSTTGEVPSTAITAWQSSRELSSPYFFPW